MPVVKILTFPRYKLALTKNPHFRSDIRQETRVFNHGLKNQLCGNFFETPDTHRLTRISQTVLSPHLRSGIMNYFRKGKIMGTLIQKKLKIFGRVQGVFFRANTQKQAKLLGLKGWVKNCSDGTVEALLEGTPEQVIRMIEWCHKGPTLSCVNLVHTDDMEIVSGFSDFSIQY
jgi:acylphosphatase